MPADHLIPRTWLVTDERQGDALLPAVDRLAAGSGILFRHYSLAADDRRRLFDAVAAKARVRGHLLILAGPPALADIWGADGWHGQADAPGLHSESVHSLAEIRAAEANGASLLFLSPVFATRSHPGAACLGARGFQRLAEQASVPVIALGGMDRERGESLMQVGAHGWAAVDAWTR